MYGRAGLDRFKKAQSLEPFSVNSNSSSKGVSNSEIQQQHHVSQKPLVQEAAAPGQSQVGGGQSSWQPPDWAIEPRAGVYYLEVMKEGEVLDRISLDRRRNIFGRQFQTCDFVLDHQSVSRQHAAVVPHKNGSVFVIDMGSAHGTFVANERLIKDTPVELEVGQSLRFAASTRTYILRKNNAALFTRHPPPVEINLPSPPDPSDEEALVTYNTLLNRYGLSKSDVSKSNDSGKRDDSDCPERARKRMKKLRVTFKDHAGGELVEVVGISDGVDVETEPGPLGVKEGSLVGKYESLVQTTIIPKGKEQSSVKGENSSQKGISDKLREVFDKVKNVPKGGIYDDLYGETFPGKLGTSWAYASQTSTDKPASPTRDSQGKTGSTSSGKSGNSSSTHEDDNDDDDDLFGD